MKDSLDLIGEEEVEMFQAKIAHHQRLGGVEADVWREVNNLIGFYHIIHGREGQKHTLENQL